MSANPEKIGRYQIVEKVGRGGMGVLYRARDEALERDVALKMMHLDFTTDSHARERFQREARAVARLQHPNIVTIHELGEFDDTPFIVMEFLEGKDLEQLLKEGTALTLGRKLDIAAQLCEGLAYAHDQGIVHRDIKPGNVRVLEDGKVKILDFGIARFAASSLTQSGTVMGTPSYMAPEQIMGQPVDGRADLFSAGVLFYELLSGHKPFLGDSPTAVAYNIMHTDAPGLRSELPDLPDAVNEIVARSLRKDPNERYSHAREMASDLQTVRMMLDLPLTAPGGKAGEISSSAQTMVISASDLYATAARPAMPADATTAAPTPLSSTSPLGDAPLRPQTDPELGGGAPAGVTALPAAKKQSPLIGIAIIIGGLLLGGWVLMQVLSGGQPDPEVEAVTAAEAAAAAAAAAGPQIFRVESDPAGAAILIDGTDTGLVTPADVPLNGVTPEEVQLTLDGHDTLTAEITEEELEAGSKAYALTVSPMPVRLTVTAPYAFELVQGSNVISASAPSHAVTVNPGGANVVARNPGLLLTQRLNINFRRSSQSIELGATGTLTVLTAPALELCNVLADGRDLGYPPITNLEAAPGALTIVLRCPDGAEPRETATVQSGQNARVTFTGDGAGGAEER